MYDIAIIGSGISSIFLAYTLIENNPNLKLVIIEKGKKLTNRKCPIQIGKSNTCLSCKICDKMQGFGGMGKSEGKYNFTNDFGGELGNVIGYEKSLKLMNEVDEILCKFGADKINTYNTKNKDLEDKVIDKNYKILTSKVRHLGTKLSYEVLDNMYRYLEDKVDIMFEVNVNYISKEEVFLLHTDDSIIKSEKLILSTGISGGKAFKTYCDNLNIKQNKTRVDIGIRVEMNENQLKEMLKDSFETKIKYEDEFIEATTYCMNPKGRLIKKHQDGLVMADGANYLEGDKSCNLNFTVFVPRYFDDNEEAREYLYRVVRNINKDNERIIVQRYEDLLNDKITNTKDLETNYIKPTIECEGVNLYDEIPYIYIDGVLKIFELIKDLINEEIHKDTLLYGVDTKTYEPQIDINENFETKEKNLFVIGDASGYTYSLSQAAASGVHVGKYLSDCLY